MIKDHGNQGWKVHCWVHVSPYIDSNRINWSSFKNQFGKFFPAMEMVIKLKLKFFIKDYLFKINNLRKNTYEDIHCHIINNI